MIRKMNALVSFLLMSSYDSSIHCESKQHHLQFSKYANFNFPHGLQPKSACLCKISSRSVKRLRRYCKFKIFNIATVRHSWIRSAHPWGHQRSALDGLYHCRKFGSIVSALLIISKFYYLPHSYSI